MPTPRLPDDVLLASLEAVAKYGDASRAADALGVNVNTFLSRVRLARRAFPHVLPPSQHRSGWANRDQWAYQPEAEVWMTDGHAVIFGDCHYGWHADPSPCHMALLKVISAIRPALVVANGDIIDGAAVSRHPEIGHQKKPSMADEVIRAQTRLGEVASAAAGAKLVRTVGNHDQRYDRTLATQAPEFAALHGMRLRDHLEAWQEAWRLHINSDVVVLHRWHGGVHAAWNNVVKAGINIVTSDTHALEVRPCVDYRGRRYGIQCGMVADQRAATFEFVAGKPTQWCEGFVVLTFADGQLLTPRLCERIGNRFWFNGEVIHAVEEIGRRPKEAAPAKAGAGRVLRGGVPSGGGGNGRRRANDADRVGKPGASKAPHRGNSRNAGHGPRAA